MGLITASSMMRLMAVSIQRLRKMTDDSAQTAF
jgi:hypothetical protein